MNKMKRLLTLVLLSFVVKTLWSANISFADAKVKSLCVFAFDRNDDGELSETEAAMVTDIGLLFKGITDIKSFDEFQYFRSVKVIKSSAFAGSSLTSISLPSSITTISENAFFGCGALKSIHIPGAVTSIGTSAFSRCKSLSSISVDGSNTVYSSLLSNGLFKKGPKGYTLVIGCNNTVIPKGVVAIASYAFEDRTGLTSITIPQSVKKIGSYAFSGCSNLANVTIEDLETMGVDAFEECNNLRKVVSTRITPPTDFFYGFPSSTKDNAILYVPKGCKAAYENAYPFRKFKEIVEFLSPSRNVVFADVNTKQLCVDNWDRESDGELSTNEAASVSDIMDVFKGTSIRSFNELRYFTGLLKIDHEAFYGCSYLTSIVIPKNVRSIGYASFAYCHDLKTVFIPNSVSTITSEAFNGCYNLGEVYIDRATPIAIDEDVFSNRSNSVLYVPSGAKAAYEVANYWKEFKEIREMLPSSPNIPFADSYTENVCLNNWDTNHDGELSQSEAAAVSDLGTVFKNNTDIVSFDELKYFTGISSIRERAFYGCTKLESVIIPNGVTSIGHSAFSGCNLTSVLIPEGVTSIGNYAFNKCIKLRAASIPSTVVSIGDYAFYNCSNLEMVNVGMKKPVAITLWVFSNRKYATLTVPKGSKTFYEAADYWKEFKNISAGMNITFADANVKKICIDNWDTDKDGYLSVEEAAAVNNLGKVFSSNDKVQSFDELNYFTGLTSISKSEFMNCTSLVSLTIPENVTIIGDMAFYGCRSLFSVNIPNSVISIGKNAFYGCEQLPSITIGNGVHSIGDYAFMNCEGLESLAFGNNVESIGNQSFYGCKKLSSVVLPPSVTTIGESAFLLCANLAKLELPPNITTIGKSAFYGCTALTNLTIPNSVTTIGDGAFCECGLESINLGCNVEHIGAYAFRGNHLKNIITIPKTVTFIGKDAFINDDTEWRILNKDVISKWVIAEGQIPAELDGRVFNYEVLVLYVPEGCKAAYETAANWGDIKTIREGLPRWISFADKSLEELCVRCWDTDGDGKLCEEEAADVTKLWKMYSIKTFDEFKFFTGVTTIGESTFSSCYDLTSIVIPNNVETIEKDAFSGCKKLASITFGNSLTSIGDYAFRDCDSLISVSFPNSLKTIGDYAFYDCRHLEAINLPEGVTSIGENAFWYCNSLESVTIPSSITSIGDYAFARSGLTSIKVYREIPLPIPENVFYYLEGNTSVTLYVPAGCAAAYREAAVWKGFSHIVEMDPPSPAISFADANVKSICVANWDVNGDGELSEEEAAAVTSIDNVFSENKSITSFDELRYFTGLQKIEELAFYKCSALTSITIPASVSNIAKNCVFAGCDALVSLKVDEHNLIYDSRDNCNAIIETATNKLVCGCPVTIIPNDVTTIGYGAFSSLKNLTGIIIPTSVTTIEYGAFCYSGLTSITIPESVTSIADAAFNDGKNSNAVLTSVTVEIKSPLAIEKNTFSRGTYANAILYVPVGSKTAYESAVYWKDFKVIVEVVGDNIIFADAHVKEICVANWDTNGDGELGTLEAAAVEELYDVFQFNEDISSFDEFQYFTGITQLNGTNHTLDMPFSGCVNLAKITLPPTLTEIGRLAFYECNSLSSIVIPKSVSKVSSEAFGHCSALRNVMVEDGNTVYDSRNNCNAIIKTATNTLVAGLASSVIPNTVTSIEGYAFYYSDIEDVTIPQSVETIGNEAFSSWNKGLKSVTVEWSSPIAINQDAFKYNYGATLYVPAGCKAAYEAAAYWQDFKEIKEIGAPDLIPLTVGVKDVTVLQGSFVEDKDAMNFDFENEETMWCWGNSPEMGIAEGSHDGSKYQTTTNPSKVEFWETQIAMDFTQLVPDEEYVLHFWAKADKSFWMNAFLQYPSDEAGWPSRGDFDWIEVGTEWQEYTLTTTVTGHNATRFLLNIGELDNGTFCLDDISLRRKNPLFTLTYDGFVDGDDEMTAFTTLPVATTTATNDSPVGTYPITISGGVSEKYSITYQPGTLTIVEPVSGDANGDGKVSVTDIAVVVNHILHLPNTDFSVFGADANGDGEVTVTDIGVIVDIILGQNGNASARKMENMPEPQ